MNDARKVPLPGSTRTAVTHAKLAGKADALIARLNQGLNARCGFLNPVLYKRCAKGVLRDITVGNNGAYAAQRGWDACTGLGSPHGLRLFKALGGRTHALKRSPKKAR